MRLLMNLSMLGPRPTGLGVYASHCARAACSAFDTDVIAPSSYQGAGHVRVRSPQDIVLGGGKGAAVRRWLWGRRQAGAKGEPRLAYSPTHHGLANEADQILTVHDLIALRFPRQHPAQHLYFRHVLPRQLQRCRAVFTVSETTRQDLHEAYRYPLDAIHVVPNGVDTARFQPGASTPREPFLLMVGAAYPHKNVEELLRFARLWRGRYRLLIASCRGRYRAQLEQAVQRAGLQGSVEFLAYVPDEELVRLYQRCSAFVYPSRWEGFGIPPLEAMACGAPVIASDIPAHREVLGGHATLVRLGDEDHWAEAFRGLAEGGRPLPASASAAAARPSPSPLLRFSWERSAALLAQSLCRVEPRLARPPVLAAGSAPAALDLGSNEPCP